MFKLGGSSKGGYLDTLRSIRTEQAKKEVKKRKLCEEEPERAERTAALFEGCAKEEAPFKEYQKMKRFASNGGIPEVVTIEMPGYVDVDTMEEIGPMHAKVKGGLSFHTKLAVEATPVVSQHILGASKFHASLSKTMMVLRAPTLARM